MEQGYQYILATDLETTHQRPWLGGILQISCVVADFQGNELAVFNEYANPGDVVYDDEAMRINGISKDDVKNFAPIQDVLTRFIEFAHPFLEDPYIPAFILGNNFSFDQFFLLYAFDKHVPHLSAKTKWLFRKLDDMKSVGRTVFPHTQHLNQEKMGNLLKCENKQRHDGLADVRQMLSMYLKMCKLNEDRIRVHNADLAKRYKK